MEIKIDKGEVLRYLGYKGGEIPGDVDAVIMECIAAMEKTAVVGYIYKVFDVSEINLIGNDIARHLDGCRKCIVMAATIGLDADALIRKTQVTDMAKAVIFDACGSAGIESVCDTVEETLRDGRAAEGMFVTGRFSPGYGDMPVSQQRELCNLLDTQRRIGLYVTGGNILVPMKSVTAVLGVSDKAVCGRNGKCDSCGSAGVCAFSAAGGCGSR